LREGRTGLKAGVRIRVEGEHIEVLYHALLPDLKGGIRLNRALVLEARGPISKVRAFLNSNLTLMDAALGALEKVNK